MPIDCDYNKGPCKGMVSKDCDYYKGPCKNMVPTDCDYYKGPCRSMVPKDCDYYKGPCRSMVPKDCDYFPKVQAERSWYTGQRSGHSLTVDLQGQVTEILYAWRETRVS